MKQIFIQTAAADLLGKAAQYKKDGYRMVQILCTRVPEGYELTPASTGTPLSGKTRSMTCSA